MPRTRTFIAVPASPTVRHAALELIDLLRPVAGDVRWVTEEKLHWTLQFLGDVDDTRIPEICDRVAAAVAELEPFDLQARGAGAFPSIDRPRTLWLGAGSGSEQMVKLYKAIERPLAKRGFRSENRRFVPHLTLGRAGRSRPPDSLTAQLATLADYDAGTMLVDEVTVFASELRREGSEYTVLARAPLAPT